MRKALAISIFLFVIALTYHTVKGQRRGRPSSSTPSSHISLAQEADRQARAYWTKRVVKCGSSIAT